MVLQFPAGDFGGVVAVVGIDGKLNASMELGVYLRKLILRRLKITEIGWSWVDDKESVGV